MLPELVTKASEEPGLVLGGAGGGALLMFLIKDFFKRTSDRSDEFRKMLLEAVKSIGQLEAARDRAKEKDEEQAKLIEALQREVRDLRDQVIELKARRAS